MLLLDNSKNNNFTSFNGTNLDLWAIIIVLNMQDSIIFFKDAQNLKINMIRHIKYTKYQKNATEIERKHTGMILEMFLKNP